MEMRIIHKEHRLCTCCMEEHEVKTVRVRECAHFKNVKICYEATYFYCDEAEELYMDEFQMRQNDVAIKEAYRKTQGLLTAKEIIAIRTKYDISQSDLCVLLGWGGKTITRYETHQVQDRAHNTILKKLDKDPEWFLDLLEEAKNVLPVQSYKKYFKVATILYEANRDLYLRKAIEAMYAGLPDNRLYNGNAKLSLDKVVDLIRYFAASAKVTKLYELKLMKLMWCSDVLSYRTRGSAITGLVYQALPMGVMPIGYDSIIDLQDVPCEEVDMGESYAYHFTLEKDSECPSLMEEEKVVLDIVIEKFGRMNKKELVDYVHRETAYIETAPREIIQFK